MFYSAIKYKKMFMVFHAIPMLAYTTHIRTYTNIHNIHTHRHTHTDTQTHTADTHTYASKPKSKKQTTQTLRHKITKSIAPTKRNKKTFIQKRKRYSKECLSKKRSAESPRNNSETPVKKVKTEEPAEPTETKVPIGVCKDSVKQLLRNTSGDIKKINDDMNEMLKKYSWVSKYGYMHPYNTKTNFGGLPLGTVSVNASRKLIHTGVFLGKDSKPMRVVAVLDEFNRPYFVRPVFKKRSVATLCRRLALVLGDRTPSDRSLHVLIGAKTVGMSICLH